METALGFHFAWLLLMISIDDGVMGFGFSLLMPDLYVKSLELTPDMVDRKLDSVSNDFNVLHSNGER